ncbi:glycosyltransferase family 2 protein [Ferrimonas balearica]|uniref:glycosyltransferase family 2 protein n=1 Tax=Ferrimonas balearica TaxID=44012 RepID=UPI001C9A22B3|nr:glycosyltransferase family 2 protein [Ferrimonas balearica]MBY5921250.1 glycosyltransferase family 2 protein [Ferrimonas balearica]MBY5996065.1 glycosyltransferase family 2 protein [Ferrimonas balearica]
MPEPWLEVLRRNRLLFSLNRFWLYRYELWVKPETATDQPKTYRNYIETVESALEASVETAECVLLVLVPKFNAAELGKTLDAARGSFSRVVLWCEAQERQTCENWLAGRETDAIVHCCSSPIELKAHQDGEYPWFVLYQGDRPAARAGSALFAFNKSNAKVGYTDLDRLTETGERQKPAFLPDWNPDLHLSTAYVATGVWVRHPEWLFDGEFSLSLTPVGLAAWLAEGFIQGKLRQVGHLPQVLVHRSADNDFSMSCWQKALRPKLSGRAHVALNDAAESLTLGWQHDVRPLVSLIIPTFNGKALVQTCIESILQKSTYQNFEILLVDNNSNEPESLVYFDEIAQHPKVRLLHYPHPFNYSAINNFAARQAQGEILGLVNNDIEVIAPDWLEQMVGHVLRDDIGCVGAKLLYPDGRIQHAGVVMGYGGGAGHAHKHFPSDHSGYLKRLVASHNFSAVTAACLLIKKRHYEQVGGFNEQKFAVAFNDVDLCLRVLDLGVRNLYCAEALLYHHESVSRGHEDTPEKMARFASEVAHLQQDWKAVIEHDPAYNPNLTLRSENFVLKVPGIPAAICSIHE